LAEAEKFQPAVNLEALIKASIRSGTDAGIAAALHTQLYWMHQHRPSLQKPILAAIVFTGGFLAG